MAYCSKYLLNRQKIIRPDQIFKAIEKYFEYLPENKRKFIYRVEWFHMGISVPVTVYSKMQPLMQVFKECQMYELNQLEELPNNGSEMNFSIFVVPSKNNKEYDEATLNKWFEKKLDGIAQIKKIEFGPNNCIYYTKDDDTQESLQTYTIKGRLKIVNGDELEKIREKCIGYYSQFGVGLLELKKAE